ncbi:hypothetical protein COV13_01455 [Candidatus Woesearchaeota archaeon CG10_big_fil_rev_8_21_14_0_10_32_9]|nr:MAG: hypothetical protein COV13_01455 [Candidatus Woesearchaeota archaeon CG10_big_fil_rev_8_21_14_0_10_32_9]
MAEKYAESEFEQMAIEDVVYGNQHALNVLLDLLIEKGIISEQEFKDKIDEMIEESPELDEVNLDMPEDFKE